MAEQTKSALRTERHLCDACGETATHTSADTVFKHRNFYCAAHSTAAEWLIEEAPVYDFETFIAVDDEG